ncbi:DUF6207 family protein [Streptomyces enissocaesilis]|uniref:Transposase n=1 Tax=Streptomyces enissocaesilis TaxID=332589 RepID=A0ABN3XR94_9ACTN
MRLRAPPQPCGLCRFDCVRATSGTPAPPRFARTDPSPADGRQAGRPEYDSHPAGRPHGHRRTAPPRNVAGRHISINERHLRAPGLVVLDVTAADETTERAGMTGPEQRWATSGITAVRREPGTPRKAKGRVYADTRRPAP